MLDDFIFEPLLRLFIEYLSTEGISVDQACDSGPDVFLEWLERHVGDDFVPDEHLDEDELISDEQEAAEIIAHYVKSPGIDWLLPFWDHLLATSRPHPARNIKEVHFSAVIRWEDDVTYPITCYVPAELIRPRNSLTDSLLIHMLEVSRKQFSRLISAQSSDKLYDAAGELVSKQDIEDVMSLAKEGLVSLSTDDRLRLERALLFVRSLALPKPPSRSLSNAMQDGLHKAADLDVKIFPIEKEERPE